MVRRPSPASLARSAPVSQRFRTKPRKPGLRGFVWWWEFSGLAWPVAACPGPGPPLEACGRAACGSVKAGSPGAGAPRPGDVVLGSPSCLTCWRQLKLAEPETRRPRPYPLRRRLSLLYLRRARCPLLEIDRSSQRILNPPASSGNSRRSPPVPACKVSVCAC